MKKCPSCGRCFGDEVSFCSECGTTLQTTEEARPATPAGCDDLRLCPNCGAKLTQNTPFCQKCGSPVTAKPKAREMRLCQNCCAKLQADSAFCEKCGAPAGAAMAPAPGPPAKNYLPFAIAGAAAAFIAIIIILYLGASNKKSSPEAAAEIAPVTEAAPADTGRDFSGAAEGDTIEFGEYQGEGIEWLVLKKEEGRLFLLSKNAIDFMAYNSVKQAVTWQTCSLRQWLNGDFIGEAFSSGEREQIADTPVRTDDNPKYGTSGGNETEDKVFLPSISDVDKYLSRDDRKCYMTEYAKKRTYENDPEWYGRIFDKFGGACGWWLRDPGYNSACAVCVTGSGDIIADGRRVQDSNVGVRPAMWIKI